MKLITQASHSKNGATTNPPDSIMRANQSGEEGYRI
jgi:hypothetical protein